MRPLTLPSGHLKLLATQHGKWFEGECGKPKLGEIQRLPPSDIRFSSRTQGRVVGHGWTPAGYLGESLHSLHMHFSGRRMEVTSVASSPLQAVVGRELTGQPAFVGGMRLGRPCTLLLHSPGSEASSCRVWIFSN